MSRSKMDHLRWTFLWCTRAPGINRRMDNAIDRQTVCRDESATSFQRHHCAFALLYCRPCRRVGAREELIDSRSSLNTYDPHVASGRTGRVAVKTEIL